MTRGTAEFLAQAACQGVRFERTLTIGRQMTFIGPHRLRAVLRDYGPAGTASRPMRFEHGPWTIEPFLSALGARNVVAMDASDYEGAEIVHDLNHPVPESLHERFTLLFDGGSLEHVFNVPVALASYMELIEVGGHLIVLTTANNFLGHGMYQFSPELFFRVLSPENGFTIERLVAMEDYVTFQPFLGQGIPYELGGRWYEVSDPAVLGERVQLQNSRPVLLAVQARRTHRVPVLAQSVQQSDYATVWQSTDTGKASSEPGGGPTPSKLGKRLGTLARRVLPLEWRMTVVLDLLPRALPFLNPFWLGREPRRRSFGNRAAYHPILRRRRAADMFKRGLQGSARRHG